MSEQKVLKEGDLIHQLCDAASKRGKDAATIVGQQHDIDMLLTFCAQAGIAYRDGYHDLITEGYRRYQITCSKK